MHRSLRRIAAFAAAVVAIAGLLPAVALADGEPPIENPNVTFLDEENTLLASNKLVAGKDATLYIPVINRGSDTLTNMKCVLPYDAKPEIFPFEGSSEAKAVIFKKYDKDGNNGKGALVDWTDGTLAAGERAWFRLSGVKALTALAQGNMQLVFEISCDGYTTTPKPLKMTIYVTNGEWKPPSGGSSFKSKPKVIIESYSFDRDRIYAGDKIRVNICVRNTSKLEAVANLQFDYEDEGGKILPDSGTSNSVFLGEIKKGEAYQMVLFLSVAPDAEAKTHQLAVTLAYEGTKNRAEFKEETSLAFSVLQRIRVRLTEPVIYGDAWVGQGVSMGLSMYNLSKATIYNCSAEVQGEGLSLEEPFFGGNIAAGGTMRADLSVIPAVAGEVKGAVLITYEDVYGTPAMEAVEFSLLVNDLETMGEELGMEPLPEETGTAAKGFMWYWWLVIAAVVVAGLIVLIAVLRRRRKKFLEAL